MDVVTKVTDHVDAAVHRVVRRSKRPVAVELVSILTGPVQDFEDLAYQVLIDYVDTAVGAQLDQYGVIVGVPRRALSDADYRALIRVKVLVNITDGTAEEVMRAMWAFLEGVAVRYLQYGSANYQLAWETDVTMTSTRRAVMLEFMPMMSPSGVGHRYVESSATGFRFDTATRGLDLGEMGRRVDYE